MARQLPGWVRAVAVGGTFLGLLLWERRRSLRRRREPQARRTFRNLALAAASGLTLQLLEKPVVTPLAELVQRRRWGLVKDCRVGSSCPCR